MDSQVQIEILQKSLQNILVRNLEKQTNQIHSIQKSSLRSKLLQDSRNEGREQLKDLKDNLFESERIGREGQWNELPLFHVSKSDSGISLFQGIQLEEQICQHAVDRDFICEGTQENTGEYSQTVRHLSDHTL